MVSRCIVSAIATAAIMLANLPVHADSTLVVQDSDGLKSTIQVKNGKGKMSTTGMDEYIIYDTGARTLTYVEPQQQRYTQMSEDRLEANVQAAANLQKTVAPYMADMLASLSPAQRRMVEQRMGKALSPPAAGHNAKADIKTVARGNHSIAGLHCKASGIVKNGRPAAEVCMVTAPGGKLSKQDFATLEAIVTFSRGMASSASGMLGDLAGQLEFLATDIDGVPIAVRDLERGKRYQVTAVSNTALSDALFSGYGQFEKQEMPGLLR
ncbi:MAG: hypothetical protein OEU51_00150 [Gammaproteobacteria bacterium]|nr:hypothetical protein [Gammaproteobacteria bacterium]